MKRPNCADVADGPTPTPSCKRPKFCSIEQLLTTDDDTPQPEPRAKAAVTSKRRRDPEAEKDEAEEEGPAPKRRRDPEADEGAEEAEYEYRRDRLAPAPDPPAGSPLAALRCELHNVDIWRQFDQLGNEMIITKSGRRMFPVLQLRFSGTQPRHHYHVFMDVQPVERAHRFRYRFNRSRWVPSGKAERHPFGRLFLHPESPHSAEQLCAQPVSFDRAKLTNDRNSSPEPEQLLLNSMHKYRPRVHVLCTSPGQLAPTLPRRFRTPADLDRLSALQYRTFVFPETKFVAVTAYQNTLVTRLKVELNPFAKGFRDKEGKEIELDNALRMPDGCSSHGKKPDPPAPSSSPLPPPHPVTLAASHPHPSTPPTPLPPPTRPHQSLWLQSPFISPLISDLLLRIGTAAKWEKNKGKKQNREEEGRKV